MLWRIFYPQLFQTYIALIVPAMFLCSRRLVSKRSTLAGLILSTASFVVVVRLPIGAGIWFLIEGLTIGGRSEYSFWNGVPLAAFMALCGACAGALIIRFIFKERIGRKEFALLYAGNLAPTALAVGGIVAWAITYPPQILA